MSTDLRHKEVYECQFEHFGRTTTPAQTEIAQGIFADRLEQGLLEEKTTEQLYSVKAGKFLADRPVEGHHVPPYYCGYADARGEDQCDNCGKLLSPTEPKGLSTCAPRGRALTMCWFRLSVR